MVWKKEPEPKLKHECPTWCHSCPDMDGAVMPMCMGTAALSRHAHDLSRCTCEKPKPMNGVRLRKKLKELEQRIEALEARPNV